MFDLFLTKYNNVLEDLQNGHPMSNCDVNELM